MCANGSIYTADCSPHSHCLPAERVCMSFGCTDAFFKFVFMFASCLADGCCVVRDATHNWGDSFLLSGKNCLGKREDDFVDFVPNQL